MSLIFFDSFDHYTAQADGALKGWSNGPTIQAAQGRFGTAALGCQISHSNFSPKFILPSPLSTIIVGAGYRGPTLWSAGGCPFILQDGATIHLLLFITAAGLLELYRGATLIGTGSTVLAVSTYYHIEMKATIHDTLGECIVNINGVEEINFTGDTRNGANASVDRIDFGASGVGASNFQNWDDLYICDDVDQSIAQPGSPPNDDFLGDCRIEALLPNANGTTSNLVGQDSNSTDNYLNVDEAAPDSDTTYNESSTVSDKDTYNYGALSSTAGTVYGVQVLAYAKKTDAGVRSIATIARSGGTEEDGATHTLTSTYAWARSIRGAKPGAAAWSISDVNAAEFGVKVTA